MTPYETSELQRLATEALLVQDACNLAAVVCSWDTAIRNLRSVLAFKDTDSINEHPINVLFASKCAQLTGSDVTSRLGNAIVWCQGAANGQITEPQRGI